MRKYLFLFVATAALTVAARAEASPVPARTTVDCTHLTVDPPAGTGVTFSGTIGGHAFTDLPAAPIPGTHESQASDAQFTSGSGPLDFSVTPTFTVPENPYGVTSGPGTTVTGTLTCHAPPTTTTTTRSTTTTTVRATTTTTARRTPPTAPRTPPPAPQLPRTGTDPWPLLVIGAAGLSVGAAVVGASRKR